MSMQLVSRRPMAMKRLLSRSSRPESDNSTRTLAKRRASTKRLTISRKPFWSYSSGSRSGV